MQSTLQYRESGHVHAECCRRWHRRLPGPGIVIAALRTRLTALRIAGTVRLSVISSSSSRIQSKRSK